MRRSTYLRTGLFLVLGAVLLVVAPVPGTAQTVFEGTITGTVMLATGEVMPGATIRLTSPALVARELTATTDARGRYVFLRVPPGDYAVSATLQGFKTANAKGIVVERGVTVDVPITLELGGYEEQVTVTSETPVVDTHSSTVSTTFSDALLAKVPTSRNAFYDLATTAPGMSSVGSEESWLPSPAAYGSATSQNIFLVNGVNTTNPRGSSWGSLVAVNYNTVEEVKILSLGSKAEYGSYSGAAIDVITKSGGNEYHGDASYYSMIGNAADNSTMSFGKSWLYANPGDSLVTYPIGNHDGGVTLGGPIMKDKLWFYGGFNKGRSVTDTPLRPNNETWDSKLYDLKVTGQFGVNHRAWLGLHYEDNFGGFTTWGWTWDPTMYYNARYKTLSPQFQYQWVATPTDIVSVKYLAFNTDEDPSIPATVGHPGYVNWWKWIGTQSIGVNGDFPYVEAQKASRRTYQADVSHYAENFLGQHDLKFGVQYTKSEGNWLGGYFQGYANFAYPYPYNYGPATSWWWNGPESWQWGTDENPAWPMYNRVVSLNPWLTIRKADSTGAFIDDTWVANDRVTINLGLRYDKMTAKYGNGSVYEMPATPADIAHPTLLRTRAGTGNVFDFKTWSPRIGVAWAVTDDHKNVLRAHYGRYYAPMGIEALRRFGPDMQPYNQTTYLYLLSSADVDLNHNGYWDTSEVIPATRLLYGRTPNSILSGPTVTDPSWQLEVAPGTKSPYTDQFNVSFQREVASDLSLEFTAIYKKENDLLALRPYDTGTGQFYEWEKMPFTTFTGYQTYVWQIVPKDYNGDGAVNIDDWRYVIDSGNTHYRAVNATSFAGKNVGRTFKGLQLVLNKRYSNRWQAMAAINWNDTDGFYPRTVDQTWYIDGPLVMDTPFGSTMNHYQNNLTGPALMTPEWMVKIAGSYTIPTIETDLGVRIRYDSGRPIWPVQDIPTFASWMSDLQPGVFLSAAWNDTMVATDPSKPDWLPSTTVVDLSLSKTFKLGNVGQLALSFDALNAFNENSPNRVGWKAADYGQVYSLVIPRTYRLGIKYSF
jgi:outer membrane receptor protein involved in Fe transport